MFNVQKNVPQAKHRYYKLGHSSKEVACTYTKCTYFSNLKAKNTITTGPVAESGIQKEGGHYSSNFQYHQIKFEILSIQVLQITFNKHTCTCTYKCSTWILYTTGNMYFSINLCLCTSFIIILHVIHVPVHVIPVPVHVSS